MILWNRYERAKKMADEQREWEQIRSEYIDRIKGVLADAPYSQASEIIENVSDHLDRKYSELGTDERRWENFRQIITDMGPAGDYAELLDVKGSEGGRFGAGPGFIFSVIILAAALITAVLILPHFFGGEKVWCLSFTGKGDFNPRTVRGLLDEFNRNHPAGVRTHHFRTEVKGERLLGHICCDSREEGEQLKDMVEKNSRLEFVKIRTFSQDEFEKYKRRQQVNLPSIDQVDDMGPKEAARMINVPGKIISGKIPAGMILIGKGGDNVGKVVLELGSADSRQEQWLDYRSSYGIDFWIMKDGTLGELRLNKGFDGFLDSGVDMSFSRDMVFAVYGEPFETKSFGNISGRNIDRVLCVKSDNQKVSRIYYDKARLVFWFEGESIKQIVLFAGRLIGTKYDGRVEDNYDLPYVYDRRVIGKWRSVDFVDRLEEFEAGQRKFKGDLFLKDLVFYEGGNTNHYYRWTKGYILHNNDKTASRYIIREIAGKRYMFLQWKSGEYVIGRDRPGWYVLVK